MQNMCVNYSMCSSKLGSQFWLLELLPQSGAPWAGPSLQPSDRQDRGQVMLVPSFLQSGSARAKLLGWSGTWSACSQKTGISAPGRCLSHWWTLHWWGRGVWWKWRGSQFTALLPPQKTQFTNSVWKLDKCAVPAVDIFHLVSVFWVI